jgi:hypothetical protein
MFAFGFATLGDRPRAAALVEDARRVMVVPIPEAWADGRTYQATVATVVSNFLFKAFQYRVDQALAGKPLAGRLSGELLAELDEIKHKARTGGAVNPYQLADYFISRIRVQSSILEPQDRIDPYDGWTKGQDALRNALGELDAIREPGELADRIRKLLQGQLGAPGKSPKEVQFEVLHKALPLAPRVGEGFVAELLDLVPAVLFDAPTDAPVWERRLLEHALLLADRYGRADLAAKLVDAFVELVRGKPEETRFRLISGVAPQCLRTLKKLGMRDEIDRLLAMLHDEILRGASPTELRRKYTSDGLSRGWFGRVWLSPAALRRKYAPKPETWSAVLQTQLNLAAGWLHFGWLEEAHPILDEARNDLLNPAAVEFLPNHYAELAQAYVAACGELPADEGFARLRELFDKMDRRKITNTWTTAQYYSRFHLHLVEDVVFAVCGMAAEQPHVRIGS